MSQLKFTADITDSEFPLLYDWAGRTVMQPQLDGGVPAAFHQPGILYAQDVIPTAAGYKSVSYKDLVGAASPTDLTFSQIFTVSDTLQNKALIGVASDSKIYMLTNALPTWVDVTPAAWSGTDNVSTGDANGTHYLYLANNGCYEIVITTPGLTLRTLSGITAANILGMFSSINYLLLWDAVGTIYWSSTTNPLDFVPSLVTGAGSAVPYDLMGRIVVVVPLNNGFVVYSTVNIILASFSNNTQFPWIFRNANNGSGVANKFQVSFSHDLGFHVVLAFSGVLYVTAQGCEVVTPEITEFLAARVYESYDTGTNTVVKTDLSAPLISRVNVVAARFIVLSYGVTEYTDLIIYDLALKRWGRMHVTHTCCFGLETSLEGVVSPYNDPAELGQSYASASPQTYGSSAVTLNNPPPIGRIFGLLQRNGTVKLAYLDFAGISDTAVLILGKFQLVRNALLELQEVAVEAITPANTGFTTRIATSINGRDVVSTVLPTTLENGTGVRRYGARAVGKNHSLIFRGSFNLTTVEITALAVGRR